MTFKGVGPGGPDIFEVKFEKGSLEYRIWLAPDGRVESANVAVVGLNLPELQQENALPYDKPTVIAETLSSAIENTRVVHIGETTTFQHECRANVLQIT